MMMAGGHSSVAPATKEIKTLAETIKPQVEAKISKRYEIFEATHYRQQVVAGMNYHIKVKTKAAGGDGEEGCIHIRVFKPLPHTGNPAEVQAVKIMNEEDELGLLEKES